MRDGTKHNGATALVAIPRRIATGARAEEARQIQRFGRGQVETHARLIQQGFHLFLRAAASFLIQIDESAAHQFTVMDDGRHDSPFCEP